eukprot:CAMPEP_0174915388 /NCGR_PEP_ID=MMETSP1355-20121228/1014_1 /TAXON_ID=464990 /ORGANISM="Hemiselmis tepida, Strain CCMP443" /LENGTH=428 /DNA_ID=CAMNT_0016160263 /DNA_START=265 /DNA_END=1548 /DNA_ORIENTATION=+
MAATFNERQFRARFDKALAEVKAVLDNTRSPVLAEDVQHAYTDKYVLAESTTNSAIAALASTLALVGLTPDLAGKLRGWARDRPVTLRFAAEQRCVFLCESVRTVEGDSVETTSSTTSRIGQLLHGKESTTTTTVKTKVKEYSWRFTSSYRLEAFPGGAADEAVPLYAPPQGVAELLTRTDQPPRPEVVTSEPLDLNATWLFQNLGEGGEGAFAVDRAAPKCLTPRRNPQADAAADFLRRAQQWCQRTAAFFDRSVFPALQQAREAQRPDLDALRRAAFVPVLPLLDEGGGAVHLTLQDVAAIEGHHKACLDEHLRGLAASFPGEEGALVSAREARLCLLMAHAQRVAAAGVECCDYVENMLRKQVVQAIGKVVTLDDMTNFMAHHARRLYAPQFAPRPFCYDVRRAPGFSPEGSLTIESTPGGGGGG